MRVPLDDFQVLTQAFSNVETILYDELDDLANERALDGQLIRKLRDEGTNIPDKGVKSVSITTHSIGGRGKKPSPHEKGDILLIATFTDERGKVAEKRALLQSKLQYPRGEFRKISLGKKQHTDLISLESAARFSAYYLLYSRGIVAPRGCFVVPVSVVHTLFRPSMTKQKKPTGQDLLRWISSSEAIPLSTFIKLFISCTEGRLVELMGFRSHAYELLSIPEKPHSEIFIGLRDHRFSTEGEREYIREDFPISF